ncbi:MAG: PIN domain-containing protein [Flavobacteriales bacterium]|nr:PIN domain-containing protein [Flavobacteriales bacterium]
MTADLAFIKIVDLDDGIKSAAMDFRARYRMKLADALIAATAIRLEYRSSRKTSTSEAQERTHAASALKAPERPRCVRHLVDRRAGSR